MTDKPTLVATSGTSPEIFPGMTALFDTVSVDPATIWIYLPGVVFVAAAIGLLSLTFSARVR